MATITLLNGESCSTQALSPAERRFYGVSNKRKVKVGSQDAQSKQYAQFIANLSAA